MSHRDLKKMLALMRQAMKSSKVKANTKPSKVFQDLFGFMKIMTDEEASRWLKDPANMLLVELYIAEQIARKGGKRKTMDTHGFEINLFENLVKLRDALISMTYYPSRGTVHIILDPVQREIFAAPYVDRILHHWVVGTIMKWQEDRLLYDSYSCREGKGTLFGIKRLQHHILSVSRNMTREAYVIQLDISGFFMHIKRDVLYALVKDRIGQQFPPGTRDKRYQVLLWAIKQVIFDDPTEGVRLQGTYRDWIGLPDDKSLMMQPKGRGIVIGNYTSQTFSNIYLDPLDRFIKFTLGYKHYGRYVDDFYIVVPEGKYAQAKKDVKVIEDYLLGIGLVLHPNKRYIQNVDRGVAFLGMVIYPYRIVPGRRFKESFY